MDESRRTGLMMLCLVCCGPAPVWLLIGWAWRGRVIQYGWLGAFVPGIIRKLFWEDPQ